MSVLEGYGSQFFQDQNVFAKDLNAIDYSKTKMFRDYLKSITKTPGVILTDPLVDTPLKVTTVNGTTFDVTAGVAIDPYGRLLQVPLAPLTASGSLSMSPAYYPAQPARTGLTTGITQAGTYYVNLEYAMIQDDLRSDDAGEQHYTRVYDSYTISVSSSRSTLGLTLATVVLDNAGKITSDTIGGGYGGYSLYDQRVAFEKFEGQFIDVNSTLAAHTADLAETLEKSIGFLYPTAGAVFYTQIPRGVLVTAFSIFTAGAGSVTATLYSGSSYAGLGSVQTTNASNYTFGPVAVIGNKQRYYQDYLIKVNIDSVTPPVEACTAIIKYTRV